MWGFLCSWLNTLKAEPACRVTSCAVVCPRGGFSLFLPPTSNQIDLFVALPAVHGEALERLESRPSAPLPRNMRRNQKRRSLGIDGGHLGRRVPRLAHSFAEVAVLVRQLRWPADEKSWEGEKFVRRIITTDYQLHGHISKPQKLRMSNNVLRRRGVEEKRWGCLGSRRTQQQLHHLVCGETKPTALVQIITLAGRKNLEPPDYERDHQ